MKQITRIIITFAMLLLSSIVVSVAPAAALAAVPLRPSITIVADSSSLRREVLANLKISWPWYVIRAAGMVAATLLILLMLSGIGLITGLTYRIMEPLVAWRLHRAMGIAFGASVAVHGLLLLIDKFVSFGVVQILIPFTSTYMPFVIAGVHLGSFGVALGVLSMYAAAIVIISSLLWMNKKPALWKFLHYLSYLLVAMVFIHGLLIGTDLKSGSKLRIIWIVAGALLLVGIISRLRRVHAIRARKEK